MGNVFYQLLIKKKESPVFYFLNKGRKTDFLEKYLSKIRGSIFYELIEKMWDINR